MADKSRRQHILDRVDDMITDLLYYDRKEDETLPVGQIEEAIREGELTVTEIIERIRAQLNKDLTLWPGW